MGIFKNIGALAKQVPPEIITKFMHKHSDRAAGAAEHVLASLVSMVGLIVLSRLMSINDFGILAIATGIWLIMEMVQHSTIISPFLMSCPNPKSDPHEFGAWFALNIVLAIIAPFIFFVAGYLLQPLVPQLAQGLMLSAPMTFVGMLYMFARRVHYHRRDFKALLIQTLSYGLSYFFMLLIVVQTFEEVSPAWGSMVLIIAYGIPAFFFTLSVLSHAKFNSETWQRIRREKKLIFELGAAGSIWQLSYTATLLLLAVLSTPAAVAIFSITRTMVRPITIMISTLMAVDFSRAVRAYEADGRPGLYKVIKGIWWAATLMTAIPMALLLMFPEFTLSLIYSEKYAHATYELQLRVLLFIPMIYGTPLDMGLAILRDTKFLVRAHTIALVIGVIILLGFYSIDQINATTALASLLIARTITSPMLHLRYRELMGILEKQEADQKQKTSRSCRTHSLTGEPKDA